MTPTTCNYCGLPFKVRRVEQGREYFCCTGCAMLSRVPVDDKGQFPVNAHLVSGIVTGFLFFNQLLFWIVATLLVRESQMAMAVRFFWLSGFAALAVWGSIAFLHWKERSARAADLVVLVLGLAAVLVAFRRFPPVPVEMAIANVLLMVWSFRGLIRKALR